MDFKNDISSGFRATIWVENINLFMPCEITFDEKIAVKPNEQRDVLIKIVGKSAKTIKVDDLIFIGSPGKIIGKGVVISIVND